MHLRGRNDILVVAVPWYRDTSLFTSLYQCRAGFYLYFFAIDCQLDHVRPPSCACGKPSVERDPRGTLGAHGSAEKLWSHHIAG